MKLRAIRENHLFSKAYAKGKKYIGRYVAVYILPDYAASRLQKADPMKRRLNRVGITVSKKLGCAVVRSRARRIIREGYRVAVAEVRPRQGWLVVIAARQGITGAKSQDIAADLISAFRRLLTGGAKSDDNGRARPDNSGCIGKNSGGAIGNNSCHADKSKNGYANVDNSVGISGNNSSGCHTDKSRNSRDKNHNSDNKDNISSTDSSRGGTLR